MTKYCGIELSVSYPTIRKPREHNMMVIDLFIGGKAARDKLPSLYRCRNV